MYKQSLASPVPIKLFSFDLLLFVFRARGTEVHAPALSQELPVFLLILLCNQQGKWKSRCPHCLFLASAPLFISIFQSAFSSPNI